MKTIKICFSGFQDGTKALVTEILSKRYSVIICDEGSEDVEYSFCSYFSGGGIIREGI